MKIQCVALLVLALPLGMASRLAQADIYRCDTTPGVITLSNVQKGKNCKKMVLPPPEARTQKSPSSVGMPIPGSESSPKASPPKYKASYDSAISERKRIIQEEIDLEQERLDAVNTKLNALNGIKNKSPAQTKELAALQKKQGLHQGNLALLQKEFSKQQ